MAARIQRIESNTALSSGFRLRQEDKLENDGAGCRKPPEGAGRELADKPGSVVDNHSSTMPVARHLH